MTILHATEQDLPAILQLQKLCFQSEAAIYGACSVPPLTQTCESIRAEYASKLFLKMTANGSVIGSIRARETDRIVRLEKLIVHPDFQNRGFGGQLIRAAEASFPSALGYELMTGKQSRKNIHLYTKYGYKIVREEVSAGGAVMVWMEKRQCGIGQPLSSEPDDCGWVCA